MTTTRSLTRRILLTVAALTVGVTLMLTLTVPGSLGAFTASITNPGNAVTTAPYLTCTSAATGLTSALAWPLDDGGVLSLGLSPARDVSGNGRSGTYTLLGVTYQQAGAPCPRDLVNGQSYAAVLNGTSAYVSYTTSFPLTNTFTESLWFKTTTTRGGRLIGFGSSAAGASASSDRMVWMSNTGTLSFGVNPAATPFKTLTTTASYNDGAWHHAVASLGASGMKLYVDGVRLLVDPTTTTAQTYASNAMYFRVGYDTMTGWSPAPTSSFFGGSVRFADLVTAQLTDSQVTSLYLSGTGS